MNFPVAFDNQAEPLAAEFDEPTNAAINDLNHRGYIVLTGFTPELAEAVSKMANEEHIKEYCPRDCTDERFATVDSTQKWLSRGHAVFVLAKQVGDGSWQPVGYGWSGPKTTGEVPGSRTTFAVRIGKAGLGQKLSLPFSQTIIGATAKIYDAKNFWLETWASNAGAVHVYEQLGFKLVNQKPSSRPTADGRTVADSRLFMSLPD